MKNLSNEIRVVLVGATSALRVFEMLQREKASPLICADAGTSGSLSPIDDSVVCLDFGAPDKISDTIMFMPAGTHTITPSQNGRPVTVSVLVDRNGAVAMEAQRVAVMAKSGKRPYFDFNHEDRDASFWPDKFFWADSPTPGIYAKGEWSGPGKAAIEGKSYRSFSPVFYVDSVKNDPARIVCRDDVKPNFGGLVNNPAFHAILPLWAKQADGPGQTDEAEITNMKKTLAELQAEQKAVKGQLAALVAALASVTDAGALSAKQNEIKLVEANERGLQLQIEIASLEAKNAELQGAETTRKKDAAKAAVALAVKRGALAPQNAELHAKWEGWCANDPTMITALEAIPGVTALESGRITHGRQLEAKEGPDNIIKAIGSRLAESRKIRGFDQNAREKRGAISREISALYAKDVSKNIELQAMPVYAMQAALEAASAADTLGTLSGTLVLQRTLEFFRINYPMFRAIYTDFSDAQANQGQTIDTRIVSKPAVQTYNKTLGADGRPAGWDTASPATTTSVTTSLDEHIGVPIVFDQDTLAKTTRRLFDEQSPAAAYAIASYFVAKLYGKVTAANFNGYAAVNGAKVPTAYATYAKGLGDFARSAAVDLNAIFNPNEVPLHDRFMLLNSGYYAQMGKDPSLVTFWAAQRSPEIITEGELPRMSKFVPIEAPDFPVSNNRVGFAFQKNALIALSRVPNDYTKVLPGASFGNVTQVTDPETGLTVMLVEYVSHTGGYAEMRMEVILGADVGDKRAGLVITSQ